MNQEVVVFTWTCRACQWTRHAPEAEQKPDRCPQCGKLGQIERVLSVPVRRGDSDPVVRQLRDLTREVEKGRQSLERYLGLHEPAVPDEVVRELEEAAQRLVDGFTAGARLAQVVVLRGDLIRVEDALDALRKAREKGSGEGSKDDADGAILVRDSSPIFGQSEAKRSHRWGFIAGPDGAFYACEKCGETQDARPGGVLYSGPCPGKQTPTGSGPTPS